MGAIRTLVAALCACCASEALATSAIPRPTPQHPTVFTLPLDLKPGTSVSREFQVDRKAAYFVEFQVERGLPFHELVCLVGVQASGFPCAGKGVVDIEWTVMTGAEEIARGNSRNHNHEIGRTIKKNLGQFDGLPKTPYVLKVSSLVDGLALAPAKPRVILQLHPKDYPEPSGMAPPLPIAIYGITGVGVIGLLIWAMRTPSQARRKPRSFRSYLRVALVIAAIVAVILAAVTYLIALQGFRISRDGFGLVVASYIRETVPGLRTPLYFPPHVQGPRGVQRTPADVAFVFSGEGHEGSCVYWTLKECYAFRVDAAILVRPDKLAALTRFVENPCASFEGAPEHERAAFRTKDSELDRLDQRLRDKVFIWRFFACEEGRQGPRTLILNFVDDMDDPTRIGESPIRQRIVKEYR